MTTGDYSAGAGQIISRAMVRDIFTGDKAQRVMAEIAMIFGLAPALAPIVGGWLLVHGDWRGIFWFMTGLGVVLMLLVWFFLEQTPNGRRLYAIGGNMEAARLAGVPVRRLRLVAFGLSSLGAATAGLMYAARVASANPTQGSGLMLDAIAAVFLGMTMSEEGEPHVLATLVGVLILGVLDNGLTQMSIDSYVRQILIGSIIVLAVASSSIGKSR